ncbi:MAG: hypothetical protein JRJ59_11510 [Deltaproteobacteria bacterium]|nr:hypothetical protein [Deltaproteobacteria bacterium]
MLPFVWEWHWDLGRIIFMGLFYLCLSAIGLGLLIVAGKTLLDILTGTDHKHH